MQYWSDWDEAMYKFKQNMGVEQGEYYDSSEEEKNEDGEIVGPRRNDFGHIGPDRADLDFGYHFGEDGEEDKREKFRNYTRPPFFLPETLQPTFYSDALTKLQGAEYQIKTLWTNIRNLRFWDGRRLGFLEEPIKEVNEAVRLTIAHVYNTIHKLKFDTDNLNVGKEAKDINTPSDRQSSPSGT